MKKYRKIYEVKAMTFDGEILGTFHCSNKKVAEKYQRMLEKNKRCDADGAEIILLPKDDHVWVTHVFED